MRKFDVRLKAILCVTAILLAGGRALAQVDPFEFEVYPYQTLGVGMVELESLNSVVPKGHTRGGNGTASGDFKSNLMYRTAFEVSYGLTDKIEAAVYLNLARPNGEGSFNTPAPNTGCAAASSSRTNCR